ncbi:hypothetical protein CPB85DRAFT_1231780 [Mucidula mucida]|nr:hypothetical protein CPB85DRAFT_1231780 [Mucidula mucida]
MMSYMQLHAPAVFKLKQLDDSLFCCSDNFVRKYLRNVLGWSEHQATKAAKKVPNNVDEVLTNAFLREAYIIRDHAMLAELCVNTDQTQITYQQGSKTTWHECGAKQVPTAGHDEKRAFTLVPSISASGDVLPMQAIFLGKSTGSCPTKSSPLYAESQKLGLRLLPFRTTTYWLTHGTMHDLVDKIIAPYFDGQKAKLGLKATQCSL